MQELSADDLDNVSGGYGYMDGVAYVCVNDPDWGTLSVDKYFELVKWTYDSYGLEIAIGFAMDIHSSLFIGMALRSGVPEYMRDTLRSRVVHYCTGDNYNSFSIWGTWG